MPEVLAVYPQGRCKGAMIHSSRCASHDFDCLMNRIIRFAWDLYVKCDEEEADTGSNCKEVHGSDLRAALKRSSKLLRSADLCQLEMASLPLSDEILSLLSSYLVDVDCRVKTLTARYATFEGVTSLVLHHFLRQVNPTEIDFEEVGDFSRLNFSPEVLQFIVTRRRFSLTCMQGSPMPLNDSILAQLTATEFVIGAPNMITIDGLRSFIEYFEPNVRLFDAIPWCLSKILDHAEVHHLLMTEYPVTEDLLVSISSRLPPGCQIHTLEIKDTRMDDVTSSTLLRFLRKVNPNKVVLKNIRGCSRELISLEVLQFIMSKPCFCVAYLSDSDWHSIPIPMDDDILRQLAAIDFEIGAPNMITLDGLKSYFAVSVKHICLFVDGI
ncbi:hypothetical protein OSTOST_08842 [Ostertagia ostertagi]